MTTGHGETMYEPARKHRRPRRAPLLEWSMSMISIIMSHINVVVSIDGCRGHTSGGMHSPTQSLTENSFQRPRDAWPAHVDVI